MLGALVLLHNYTGNATLLRQAAQLAEGAFAKLCDADGIVTEHSLPSRTPIYFRSVLLHGFRQLYTQLGAHPSVLGAATTASLRQRLLRVVRASAAAAATYAWSNATGLYAASWHGPVNTSCLIPGGWTPQNPDHLPLPHCVGPPAQTSALHLLVSNGTMRDLCIGSDECVGTFVRARV